MQSRGTSPSIKYIFSSNAVFAGYIECEAGAQVQLKRPVNDTHTLDKELWQCRFARGHLTVSSEKETSTYTSICLSPMSSIKFVFMKSSQET